MTDSLQPVPPIRIEPPPVSILTVGRQLPEGTVWRSGISHLPNGGSEARNYPNCDQYDPPGIAPVKCGPEQPFPTNFDSWLMYVPDGCEARPFYAEDWPARAREALEAYTAWGLSREMSDGAASGSDSLQSTATDLTPGGGAVDVVTALSALLRARVEAGFGGVCVAHVPMWLIPALDDHYQLQLGGGAATTALGFMRVSPGPGYTGAAPDGTPAPAGEGTIYLTGPVEYALGPIEVHPDRDQQQRLTNNVEVYAERAAVYRFDTIGVFSVRAKVNGS